MPATDLTQRAERTRAWMLERIAERQRHESERARMLRSAAGILASELAARGAEHVWLFGSLAGGHVHEASDLDLAVSGLDGEEFDAALRDLSQKEPALDLVRWEEAPATLKSLIARYGELLHGAR